MLNKRPLNVLDLYDPFQPILTKTGLGLSDIEANVISDTKILTGKVHSYLQIKASKPTRYMIMPDGTQAIFVSPDRSLLGGSHAKSFEMKLSASGTYFGIRFFPGALRQFFNVNLSEITGNFADHKYLPLSDFINLPDRIYSKDSFKDRAKVCESWLVEHYNPMPNTVLDVALRYIYKARGNIKVSELSKQVGCSSRHLNRHFLLHVGVNTKTFTQIVRVQNVYKQRYLNPAATLNAVLDAGYYDQPHFLNTAKKMLSDSHRLFFDQIKSDFCNI